MHLKNYAFSITKVILYTYYSNLQSISFFLRWCQGLFTHQCNKYNSWNQSNYRHSIRLFHHLAIGRVFGIVSYCTSLSCFKFGVPIIFTPAYNLFSLNCILQPDSASIFNVLSLAAFLIIVYIKNPRLCLRIRIIRSNLPYIDNKP